MRAVVYQSSVPEYETFLKHFQEDPLGPFVIVFVCCIDHTIPIKRESYFLQLVGEFLNILICDDTWMCSCLYCVVLCRKAECIKSDWEKYIVSLHTTFSGNNFQTGICFDMSYVHSCTAWIWKLYKAIEFRFITVVFGFEDFTFFPFRLPLRLDLFKQVFHFYASSNICCI